MTVYRTRAERSAVAGERQGAARRRAREASAVVGVELTLDDLFARDQGYCHLCRLPVPREQASKDHVTPLAKGGARDQANEALAHRRCNSAKGARGPRRKGLRRTTMRPKPRPPQGPPEAF